LGTGTVPGPHATAGQAHPPPAAVVPAVLTAPPMLSVPAEP
jgi:hypothetical protein